MPIYEYVCDKCGHHLEVMQKMSDKPLSKCPQCRGKLEKIFSQTSFQLKGSGWYASDYTSRGKTEKTEKKAEKGEKGNKKDAAASSTTPAGTSAAGKGGAGKGGAGKGGTGDE